MNILKQGKDRVLSMFLRQRIQELLDEEGRVEAFDIDSEERSIRLSVQLRGESEPVEVRILHYRIEESGGEYFFCFEDFSVSKEWIDGLLRRHLKKRRIPIPDEYGSVAQRIL